jgi:hypothetical protein
MSIWGKLYRMDLLPIIGWTLLFLFFVWATWDLFRQHYIFHIY